VPPVPVYSMWQLASFSFLSLCLVVSDPGKVEVMPEETVSGVWFWGIAAVLFLAAGIVAWLQLGDELIRLFKRDE